MKKNILLCSLLILSSCTDTNIYLNESTTLHKHYCVKATSVDSVESYTTINEDSSNTIHHENNCIFKIVNVEITHDETNEDVHKLDNDDFKLVYGKSSIKPLEDYSWILHELEPMTTYTCSVAFKISRYDDESYLSKYLEIDFEYGFINGKSGVKLLLKDR